MTTPSPLDQDVISQAQIMLLMEAIKRPVLPICAFELVRGEPYKFRFVMANGSAIQVNVDLYHELAHLSPQALESFHLGSGHHAVYSQKIDLCLYIDELLSTAGAKRMGYLDLTTADGCEVFDSPCARYIERLFKGGDQSLLRQF